MQLEGIWCWRVGAAYVGRAWLALPCRRPVDSCILRLPLVCPQIYDPVSNAWYQGAPLPEGRGGMGKVRRGSRVEAQQRCLLAASPHGAHVAAALHAVVLLPAHAQS